MAPHADADIRDASTTSKSDLASNNRSTKWMTKDLSSQRTSHKSSSCSMLRVEGERILDENNEPVVLKGAGVGGAWNMENFITGYSGHEHEHRAALAAVLGPEKAQFYFDKLLEYFFTESDAEFFASLGLNCIRIPFNYRHFIDDQNPSELKPSGFAMLDRIVQICDKYDIYVILDLHSVPGGQNQDWHSDSGTAKALFWEHRVFQDQAIALWVAIAQHFAGNPAIAGYNPLNEPADPEHTRLVSWYARAEKAIRAVDPHHILFIDGNTYAMDFSQFPANPLPNSVYACHDYAMQGFPIPGQAPYTGTDAQKWKLQRSFDRKATYMREKGVPVWNGEFGPVYADPSVDEDADPSVDEDAETTNEGRYGVLKEQLSIYAASDASWSIWLYKDIGYQGMVHVAKDSAYMKLIAPFVAKKQRLGLDFWGVVDKGKVNDEVYGPFIAKLKEMVPEHLQTRKYPKIWTFDRQVERVVRECLLSEYLTWEFAELFRGKTEEELDELASAFKFETCEKREKLNEILKDDAERRA